MSPGGVWREKFHSLGNFCPCQCEVLRHHVLEEDSANNLGLIVDRRLPKRLLISLHPRDLSVMQLFVKKKTDQLLALNYSEEEG